MQKIIVTCCDLKLSHNYFVAIAIYTMCIKINILAHNFFFIIDNSLWMDIEGLGSRCRETVLWTFPWRNEISFVFATLQQHCGENITLRVILPDDYKH